MIDVVLTKACNLACTFCRDYETQGSQQISLENFENVVRLLLPTARRMCLCSGGEPYLHKGLEQILRYARQYGVFTWLLSNGMLMPDKRLETLLTEDLVSQHGFSVDGYNDATVEQIRTRAKLATILGNIEKLIRMRDAMKKTCPRITIRYALMRMNVEELPRAVERWGAMGIDELECNYLAIANGIDRNESLFHHQELTERVFNEARRAALKYPKLKLGLPDLVRDQVRFQTAPRKCTQPWDFVMIDTNGDILPCYCAFEALSMGNIYSGNVRDFGQVWNSDDYQKLRGSVNADAADKRFSYCGQCERRYGWGAVDPHLGDETWIKTVNEGRATSIAVDHRRSSSKRRASTGTAA